MRTIWKYTLNITDEQIISLPRDFKILCVQIQNNEPCLWIAVNTEAQETQVLITIHGTGHHQIDASKDMQYIGPFALGFVQNSTWENS